MNPFFEKAKRRAQSIFNQPNKVKEVLQQAREKSSKVVDSNKKLKELKDQLVLAFDMIKDSINGDYKSLPKTTLIKVLAAILYFVFPTDLIPDFILGLGFLDDATVLAWVFSSIQGDMKKYKEWADAKKTSTKEEPSAS